MGWLVYRDSVVEFLAAEQKAGPTVGFPRGGVRSKEPERKPPKAAKASKPAKKPRRG
jgi:hypothetical protein